MSNSVKCSFCTVEVHTSVSHDCSEQIFKLLNSIAEPRDQNNALRDIENLVFQGGGVKGISYLGVAKQLQELKQYPNFLDKVKRIAGTSAGSLIALYLSLNMSTDAIEQMLRMKYVDLLDTDFKLLICTNPTSGSFRRFFQGGFHYIERSVRFVFLSAMAKFQKLKEDLESEVESTRNAAKKELSDILTDMMKYFEHFGGLKVDTFLDVTASTFAQRLGDFLMDLMVPGSSATTSEQPDQNNQEGKDKEVKVAVEEACEEAVQKVRVQKPLVSSEIKEKIPVDLSSHTHKDLYKKEVKKPVSKQNQKEPELSDIEKVHIEFYLKHKAQPCQDVKPADEVKFVGNQLNYALGEMLWFLLSGHQYDLGLFSANIIKHDIIYSPIQQRLQELGISNPTLTFGEMALCKDKQGNKAFKDLYITSFNCATERTEVFSATATPNVRVDDAVRASMSIPVFFTPVTIREKDGQPLVTYTGDGEWEETKYMDGGILDNYPIWIFDDLKFCLMDKLASSWVPKYRLNIQNPRTLGFRIMDAELIERYMDPYADKERLQLRRLNSKKYSKSAGYMMGSLMSGYLGHEESAHINQGHCPRTIYINNRGFSAISFNMEEVDQNNLIEEGRNAVMEYLCRANKTSFIGEGQKYDAALTVNA